jgi:hypothetical protein
MLALLQLGGGAKEDTTHGLEASERNRIRCALPAPPGCSHCAAFSSLSLPRRSGGRGGIHRRINFISRFPSADYEFCPEFSDYAGGSIFTRRRNVQVRTPQPLQDNRLHPKLASNLVPIPVQSRNSVWDIVKVCNPRDLQQLSRSFGYY